MTYEAQLQDEQFNSSEFFFKSPRFHDKLTRFLKMRCRRSAPFKNKCNVNNGAVNI